jgi:hypothetical protein
MLDAIPDLRPTLRAAAPDELADLFDAFDVTAIYKTLELRATVTPELVPEDETPTERRPVEDIFHTGAGYGHLPPTPAYCFVTIVQLP